MTANQNRCSGPGVSVAVGIPASRGPGRWSSGLLVMIIRNFIILAVVSLSVTGFGQSIPYAAAKTLEDCAAELRQIKGVTAELELEHSNPEDTREFRLWLETPGDRKTIEVSKEGTFRLPKLSVDDQEGARVTHSLEAGALTLSFAFHWNGELTKESLSRNKSLFETCTAVAGPFSKFEPVFVKLGNAIPGLKDFQIAIVGVSLAREKPCSGLAILKNGEKTVDTIDLSQTGKASWMFGDYDPRTHRVVFEMKNGDSEPKLFLEIQSGEEVARVKGAILVRKLQ